MGELPVFTCQAHVFAINPTTKKSWIPSSSKAVDVNVFYDPNKHCHRIISVEDTPTGKKVIINSTLSEKMNFKKTSQKFGQWADPKTNGVHGLGFSSETELTEFANHFKRYVEASKLPSAMTSLSSLSVNGINHSVTDQIPTLPSCNSQTLLLPQSLSQLTGSNQTMNTNNTLCTATAPVVSLFASKCFASALPQTLADLKAPISTSALSHDTHSSLQQKLAQAQAQVRRLESELTGAKQQVAHSEIAMNEASHASSGSTATNLPDFRPKVELINGLSVSVGNGVKNTSSTGSKTEVEKWVNENFSGVSVSPGKSLPPPAGPSSTNLMALVGKQPVANNTDLSPIANGVAPRLREDETSSIQLLHTRLGYILREAVELHTRLGILLSSSSSGQPYYPPSSG